MADSSSPSWRARYDEYILSPQWEAKRQKVFLERDRCERCGRANLLEVHHVTYERLGREPDSELEVLCSFCHTKADQERALRSAARSADAKFRAGLNTYATKKYGEDWQDRYWDLDRIEDEFERWLERKEGEC
jgi:HNH endonuclease